MICYSYLTKHTSKALTIPQMLLWAQWCPSTFTWRLISDNVPLILVSDNEFCVLRHVPHLPHGESTQIREGFGGAMLLAQCLRSPASKRTSSYHLLLSLTTELNEMCPKTLRSM
jgi:hypothetical protein